MNSQGGLPENICGCYKEFFLTEKSRNPGEDVYADIFDSPLLFPLQRQREMSFMMQKARAIQPTTVFEIGTDKGGGLYHWCKCLTTVERVIACEIRGIPFSHLFELAFPHIDFLWLPTSSYDHHIVAKVKHWLGSNKIDCLFIDGDKLQFHTDFWCYKSMMASEGIVFMHDIHTDIAPKASFGTVVSRGFRSEKYINTSESVEAVKREKQNIKVSSSHEQWLRHWKGSSAGVGVVYLGEKK